MILLTGYGPFGDVLDNPSARLVRAVHGLSAAGHRLHSMVLPVSWAHGPSAVIAAARALKPEVIVGFGVATTRDHVDVESVGTGQRQGVDVDGNPPPDSIDAHVAATVDVQALASALGASVSQDAGRFLCNAWITQVTPAVACPAVFVHIPPEGMAPHRLLRALDALPTWATAAY